MQNSENFAGVAPAPKRGRPRAFDRKAALSAATLVFWEKGYHAASITDLTAAMKIGCPSLYAAFGSKQALFSEALNYYGENYGVLYWTRFLTAGTAREAIELLLLDSAAILTRCVVDAPLGCMVTLAAVGNEGYPDLGELVRSARAIALERLKTRIRRAVNEGEIPASADVHAIARFVQTVQSGMSILARDGASSVELKQVAETAMLAWDGSFTDAQRK